MDFTYSDEQVMLRDGARRFLGEQCRIDRVREIVETDDGFDAGLWSGIAEQGWTAMHIPEEYGGAGFSYAETAVLLHEMGRVLAPVPYLSSAVLAAEALLAGGSEEQKAQWLPALAAGEAIGTVAIAEPGGGWEESSVSTVAEVSGDGYAVTGTKSFVTAGRIAEGWPTEAYRLRADRLAASVEALSRTAPPEAIVGAPEFWAALHLHGGWTVAPSVRFDPRNVDPETPMWGTPEEQLALWRESRIDHLLLEQNGVLHGDALDRLEAECPGSVFVLARMPSSLLVRLDWASSCEGSGA